jgi:hypothetical protein
MIFREPCIAERNLLIAYERRNSNGLSNKMNHFKMADEFYLSFVPDFF